MAGIPADRDCPRHRVDPQDGVCHLCNRPDFGYAGRTYVTRAADDTSGGLIDITDSTEAI